MRFYVSLDQFNSVLLAFVVLGLLGRLFDRVDLIKLISNVPPSVPAYIHTQNVYPISMKFGV